MGEFDEIEVQSRFDGKWVSGFELCDVDPDEGEPTFTVRRRSDGYVLPDRFGAHELRPPQRASDAAEVLDRYVHADRPDDAPGDDGH